LGVDPTPLKNMKVSWDYYIIIPNIWKNNPNVPNHQPAIWIGTNPPEEFPWEKLPVIIWMTLFFSEKKND
jgi:hypothetical protein